MKILVLAPQPFYTSRGTPLSVYYRALVMAEQGASIDLLTYGTGENVRIPGVRVIRVPRLKFLEPLPIGPSWTKLLLDVFLVVRTIGLLLRHRYEAVHAHEEAVFWCRLLMPVFRFKLIYDMHSSLPQQLVNFRFTTSRLLIGTFRALESSSVKAATAVIAVCPDLRDYAVQLGARPERVLLIENSLVDDVQAQHSTEEAAAIRLHEPVDFGPGHPVILYAGTFEVYQGVELLVEAFAGVIRQRPDARLLLVGGNDQQVMKIRALADALGVGDFCVLTGHVWREIALNYERSAQVLVSLRLHGNNTPLKIYEQLASGRPLVATRVWAHTQVLDDSVCFLVEPDPESVAGGLIAALNDETDSARRAANARARFERDYSRAAYEKKISRLLAIVS